MYCRQPETVFPWVFLVISHGNNMINDSVDDLSRVKRNENRPFYAHPATLS